MEARLWDEMMQSKHGHFYSLCILQNKKDIIKWFNIVTLSISGAGGILGWKVWTNFPVIVCIIIAVMQLIKLLQPQIIPSDKELDKLNKVINFYVDYYNKLESLWYDHYNNRINDEEAQRRFYELKESEKSINDLVNEVIKKGVNKKAYKSAEVDTNSYVQRTFNR